MEITILSAISGKQLAQVHVEPSWTVRDVRTAAQAEAEVNVAHLLLGGQRLDDSEKVASILGRLAKGGGVELEAVVQAAPLSGRFARLSEQTRTQTSSVVGSAELRADGSAAIYGGLSGCEVESGEFHVLCRQSVTDRQAQSTLLDLVVDRVLQQGNLHIPGSRVIQMTISKGDIFAAEVKWDNHGYRTLRIDGLPWMGNFEFRALEDLRKLISSSDHVRLKELEAVCSELQLPGHEDDT
ncbi:unnamed protein product [Polarella glacialis]|uniref:Uncharacterized protein n=1 Tax=Polarella glacialis TaxID=89957 RepID=A0A813IPB6_POLGL|nr:unnamed protein product [Polarella glacialis]